MPSTAAHSSDPTQTTLPDAAGSVRAGRWWVWLALLLPPLLTVAMHALALHAAASVSRAGLLWPLQVSRIDDRGLVPPPLAQGRPWALPFFEPAAAPGQPAPLWLVAGFTLAQPAGTTWLLALNHRTPVLVYLDGRLLAHSVPLPEADLPMRNLLIGERRLEVSVPAEWLTAGAHEVAVRVGAAGSGGASLTGLSLGPAPAMKAADLPRRFWIALRVTTALSAGVIGTLLLFAWLVERRARLFLWSGLQLWMLTALLLPYVVEAALLPAPWWRVGLDMADVLAKGLAPLVIMAWAAPHLKWVRQLAFGYLAVALPVDALAAYFVVPWVNFDHPWPWWALASRMAVLCLAVWVAARALRDSPDAHRFGTLLLAGLALWIWIDVTLTAIVWPGRVAVVDLNVVAYAGWALWMGMLLHRRLVDNRRQEIHLRAELAQQLAQRSEELRAQYAALQASESARSAAAERERLLQEMHDGVGAQLTSAKMLASSGQLSSSEMVDTLDECLREMRLTVDALGVTDGDLGLLLATLRHRLEPALRAGGITLDWQVVDAPCVPALVGTGARELARIVQEALSNTMHHAGATRVSVSTRLLGQGGAVQVCISDNGCGLPADLRPGRGLRNMRQRAQRLSARIEWRRPPAPCTGTDLVIELTLAAQR
jgi:signal transduction histidine kinase